jgi:hypothetical protein
VKEADYAARFGIEVAEPEPAPLGPEAETSLDLLQAIYRSPYEPIHRRMRAAIAALPFEHPKLAVVAHAHGGGFADHLEAAIKRAQGGREGTLIEGTATEQVRPVSPGDRSAQ